MHDGLFLLLRTLTPESWFGKCLDSWGLLKWLTWVFSIFLCQGCTIEPSFARRTLTFDQMDSEGWRPREENTFNIPYFPYIINLRWIHLPVGGSILNKIERSNKQEADFQKGSGVSFPHAQTLTAKVLRKWCGRSTAGGGAVWEKYTAADGPRVKKLHTFSENLAHPAQWTMCKSKTLDI